MIYALAFGLLLSTVGLIWLVICLVESDRIRRADVVIWLTGLSLVPAGLALFLLAARRSLIAQL